MPDPLSTIFISSPISGATRVNQLECQSVNHYYTREAYRWIPCGEPPSGSSSARRSTCSKTPCSPVERPFRPPTALGIRSILVYHPSHPLLARLVSHRLA